MANRSPIESSKQLHNVELNKAPESSFEKPGTVMRWLWNYYDSIFRITLILLLLLSERVVQDKLFVCPYKSTQHNILYSFAFISVPAVVLFGAAIMLNNQTWRAVTLFKAEGKKRACKVLSRQIPRALIAPYVWVVFAFLDGRFYSCMHMDGNIRYSEQPSELQLLLEEEVLHTNSQLIGYAILFLGLVACFICMCITQFTDPVPHEHQTCLNIFEHEFAIQRDALIRDITRTAFPDIKIFMGEASAEERTGSDSAEGKRKWTLNEVYDELDKRHDVAIGLPNNHKHRLSNNHEHRSAETVEESSRDQASKDIRTGTAPQPSNQQTIHYGTPNTSAETYEENEGLLKTSDTHELDIELRPRVKKAPWPPGSLHSPSADGHI